VRIAMLGARSMPAAHGGLERAVEELSAELATRGHEVHVFADRANSTSGDYRGFVVRGVPAVRTRRLHTLSQVALSIPGAVRGKYDVIHIHGVGPNVFSRVFRPWRLATVLTVQGIDWRRDKWAGLSRQAFARVGEMTLGSATKIITVSRTLQEVLAAEYGQPSAYVPNGVRIPKRVGPGPVLDSLGVTPAEYLLFVGRLVPEKGVHYLLEAHALLGSAAPPLVIVGSGAASYESAYESQLRRTAGESVIFAGWRAGEELAELFSNARCYVMPSTLEGLPISLLEAMSYALPVVHSDIPECSEVTHGRGAGRSFVNRDAGSLAEALSVALSDPDGAKRMGEEALRVVQRFYSWEQIADETEVIYRSAVESRT
jgi:glycosyltransferase involved in cell wall biosynthesis